MARLRSLMLLVALLAATGAHWAILQSFAWTTMLAQNLRADSFASAVAHTFDGHHPCGLCKAIDAGKNAAKRVEYTCPISRFEFPVIAGRIELAAPGHTTFVSVENQFAAARSLEPPTPPPRALCA